MKIPKTEAEHRAFAGALGDADGKRYLRDVGLYKPRGGARNARRHRAWLEGTLTWRSGPTVLRAFGLFTDAMQAKTSTIEAHMARFVEMGAVSIELDGWRCLDAAACERAAAACHAAWALENLR